VKTSWVKVITSNIVTQDQRGGSRLKNAQLSVEKRLLIKKFLETIPKDPSYYQRSTANLDKLYIEGIQKVADLYRQFETWCNDSEEKLVPSRTCFINEITKYQIKFPEPTKEDSTSCLSGLTQ